MLNCICLLISQILTHLSSPPDAIKKLSGETFTDLILHLLLFILDRTLFSPKEYTFIVLSFPPDTMNFPVGEKSTDLTGAEWKFKILPNPCMLFFQSLTVESLEHDAIILPMGFMDTSLTEFLWPINFIGLNLGFKLNIKTFPSSLPVIICFL
jgi:hypothetical protein